MERIIIYSMNYDFNDDEINLILESLRNLKLYFSINESSKESIYNRVSNLILRIEEQKELLHEEEKSI